MKLSPKDLFRDLTWAQVGAGALAAATALFLSSTIGIAGSIIGAAVGSVVTTLSSALYKSVFAASGDALKKMVGDGDDLQGEGNAGTGDTRGEGTGEGDTDARGARGESMGEGNTNAKSTRGEDTDEEPAAPENAHRDNDGERTGGAVFPRCDAEQTMPAGTSHASVTSPVTQTVAMPVAAARASGELERVRAIAAQRKAKRRERLAIIVALATGLVTVGICAVVIAGATGGEGLGYKPAPLIEHIEQPTAETPATSTGDTDAADLAPDTGQTTTEPKPAHDPNVTDSESTDNGSTGGEDAGAQAPSGTDQPPTEPDNAQDGNGTSDEDGVDGEAGGNGNEDGSGTAPSENPDDTASGGTSGTGNPGAANEEIGNTGSEPSNGTANPSNNTSGNTTGSEVLDATP